MAAAFLAFEFPYATAAGIGAGFFAISYLAAKKATKAPNDNLYWLLFGGNYVNPQQAAIDTKNQTTFWEHPVDFIQGYVAEKGGVTVKPLTDADGKPYYVIAGKHYTPQELYMNLHSAKGIPQRPVDWPSDLNVDDSRQNIGNYRPSANDPTLLVQDPMLAKQIPSFYPTVASSAGPSKANAALSLAEKEYVDLHREVFQQVYGNKELSSSDVEQVWVAYYHASRPDTRTDRNIKAWVNSDVWMQSKDKETQDKYDADIKTRAQQWAQQVGTGAPITQVTPTAPKVNPIVQTVINANPVSAAVASTLADWFGNTKGTVSTTAITPKPVVVPTAINTAPPRSSRPPTRGRGW